MWAEVIINGSVPAAIANYSVDVKVSNAEYVSGEYRELVQQAVKESFAKRNLSQYRIDSCRFDVHMRIDGEYRNEDPRFSWNTPYLAVVDSTA